MRISLDNPDKTKLSTLAALRVLVACLGESVGRTEPARGGWWQTQFTTQAGLQFARQIFPRSWASGAVGGAARAAREIHDERIGRKGTRHLFRFDDGLERRIHHEILHADQSSVADLIQDKDTAMKYLESIVKQSVSAAPGPVQVGELGQELDGEIISDMAAHYFDAFNKKIEVFPYFAGSRQ